MRILGLDPGLNVTGYALLSGEGSDPELKEAGVLRTTAGVGLAERLGDLKRDMAELVRDMAPDSVAVEALWSHYNHPRTAILMGHARGVILATMAAAGLSVHSYAPARVKKAIVGNGQATKIQVQRMVQTRFKLAKPPEPPDAADAVAVALTHWGVCYRRRTDGVPEDGQ